VQTGEPEAHAIVRTLATELGIQVAVEGVPKLHAEEKGLEMTGFLIQAWQGEIRIGDTEHCADLAWCDPFQPPETTPSTGLLISALREYLTSQGGGQG
jgi:hypothetical protein